jgi:conjugative transfer signal peptidase TraF
MNQAHKISMILSTVLLFIIGSGVLLKQFGVAINLTSSMPLGVYLRINKSNLQQGDIVAICLPKAIAQEGLHKHYLSRGHCATGTMPVIKQVIAIPGDNVSLSAAGMTVEGKFFKAPIQQYDHHSHTIRQFVLPGYYPKTTGVWLYGNNNVENSWDSRYFGGIEWEGSLNFFKLLL